MINLQILKSYDFTLFAPGVLGQGYNNATVTAIMDFDSAKQIQDIIPLHTQAYPDLPIGTPRNAKDLIYVKLKTSIGETRVVAMNWISGDPVLVNSQTVKVIISNISSSDIPRIASVLNSNGFLNVVIEVT